MASKVIRIDAKGSADRDRLRISRKGADTVQWVSASNKEWLVVFRGNCPFTDRDFGVPAQAASRLGYQCSGLQAGEVYVYDIVPAGTRAGKKGGDPMIEIIP